jgi:uncharacterized membrane protein YozB (DUF420 family)
MEKMNTMFKSESHGPEKKVPKKSDPARFFYLGAALTLLALTLAGFQEFYLHGREFGGGEIPPRIFLLVIAHAVFMSCWILLFITQPLLIVSGHRRSHMMLGRIATVLAAAIIVTGTAVAIGSARVHPKDMMLDGMPRSQFLAAPLSFMAQFFVFVSLGVLTRRRPEIHRSMMLLATLVTVEAATDRIPILMHLYNDDPLKYFAGPAVPILIVGALFLVVRWLLTRRFDRWYALGYAGLFMAAPLIMDLSRSRLWGRISSFLLQ